MPMALATVTHVEDSSYRRAGARMLIMQDGQWIGGISGGCLEGDVLRTAQRVLWENEPTSVQYDTRTDDPHEIGIGLGCQGLIDVFIQPLNALKGNPINALRKCLTRRRASVLISVLSSPSKEYRPGLLFDSQEKTIVEKIFRDNGWSGLLVQKIAEVKANKKSTLLKISESREQPPWKLFLEYVPPQMQLFIFGKNYDVFPLLRISKELGWKTFVCAPPQKISKPIYHLSDNVLSPLQSISRIDQHSAVLIMAHDYRRDFDNFQLVMETPCPYIGILGPKKRAVKLLQEQLSKGKNIDDKRIFAPVGLDTGATTPEEIAISILAEIRTHFSGRSGSFLREREGRIHD